MEDLTKEQMQKRIEDLEFQLKQEKNKKVSNKEFYIRQIAELFKENPITIQKYKHKDEEKSYEKLKDFYDALGRIGKDNLIELQNKIKSLIGSGKK